MKKPSYLWLILLAVLGTNTSYAHGIWVAERLDRPTLIYGDGSEDSRYDAGRVGTVIGFDDKHNQVNINVHFGTDNAWFDLPEETAVVVAKFKDRIRTQDDKGVWHVMPREQVPNPTLTAKNFSSTVTLLKPTATALFAHLPLQIVPQTNPFELKKGNPLTVQVFLHGKPIQGVELRGDYINDSKNIVRTDRFGKATVVLGSNGVNVIKAGYNMDNPNKLDTHHENHGIDSLRYATTLAFNLEQE